MALKKKCIIVAASKRAKQHVRCMMVKAAAAKSAGKKSSGKSGGGSVFASDADFDKNYNDAVGKGFIPKDMSFKEVSEMSGYHSDFGTIKKQTSSITKKGLEIEIETDQIYIRSIHSKGKVYIDEVKDKGIGDKGKARKIIGNIIKRGEQQDLKSIELFGAARLRGEEANGFYTWPRLGFETGNKSALKQFNSYDKRFKDVDSFHTLFSTKEGRDYWRSEGKYHPDSSVYEMTFDLRYGSKSREMFDAG